MITLVTLVTLFIGVAITLATLVIGVAIMIR